MLWAFVQRHAVDQHAFIQALGHQCAKYWLHMPDELQDEATTSNDMEC